jgi:hypothetical protein
MTTRLGAPPIGQRAAERGRGRDGPAGMEQAAGADVHDAVRPDRREDPAATLSGVKGQGCP